MPDPVKTHFTEIFNLKRHKFDVYFKEGVAVGKLFFNFMQKLIINIKKNIFLTMTLNKKGKNSHRDLVSFWKILEFCYQDKQEFLKRQLTETRDETNLKLTRSLQNENLVKVR